MPYTTLMSYIRSECEWQHVILRDPGRRKYEVYTACRLTLVFLSLLVKVIDSLSRTVSRSKMQGVLIWREGANGTLYVHHDPIARQYLVQAQQVGACVFNRLMAIAFIQTLDNPAMWKLEAFTATVGHRADTAEGQARLKKLQKKLQKLPGYTKSHSSNTGKGPHQPQ